MAAPLHVTAALDRISRIQAEIAPLLGGGAPAAAVAQPVGAAAASPAVPASFAAALTQAQAPAVASGLPAPATRLLTPGQQQFAQRLATDTGLDPRVISAWLLAEESGGAAGSREQAGNHDWLNIGYTDSGTFGAGNTIWRDPLTAADATAGWLRGQDTIPGYGRASAGIQAILGTAGQAPEAQITALQHSGWASSGYPDLPGLLQQMSAP